MPIKTNLKSLAPRRIQYKKEITLLSHGYTNPVAWPDGRITVFPWDSSIDAWLIDNVRRLNKQDLIYELVQKCCDLNGGNIDDLVAEEVSIILLVSRALTADGEVRYQAECPYCGHKTEETIKIPDELEKVGEKSKDYPGYDVITLPIVQDVVKIRPLLIKDEKKIINRDENDRKKIPDMELRTLMRVLEINDSKPDTLDELLIWYRALHAKDAKYLEEKGRELTPHLNTNIPHICSEPDCGKEFTFLLTFDQEFFR